MSEFMFAVNRGKLDVREVERREAIAEKHEVTFVYIKDPGQGYLSWFAGPNRGEPFDGALRRAVVADIEHDEDRGDEP